MRKGMSIKTKVAITAVFFMGVLTAAIAVTGYKLYHDSVMESYTIYMNTILEYAYREAQQYGFGDMIAQRDMPEGYEELRAELNRIKDCSNIEYLYAVYFEEPEDIHSLHYAINAKSAAELSMAITPTDLYSYMGKPCEAGGFADDTLQTLQQAVLSESRENGMLQGYAEEYGHMLNGYRVLFDSRDRAVGLLCVEIDINRINVGVHQYVRSVVLLAAVLTAVIVLIYILNTQRYLIGPITRIAASSDDFVRRMQSNVEPEQLQYEDVPIASEGELRLLADNVKSLADGVAAYMSNLKSVTSERERIDTELALAARIQADMLPNVFPAFPARRDFDVCASMDPAREVGGDFYDFFLIDESHLGLVIADVSGKGVPAALFMMIAKLLLQNSAMAGLGPAEALRAVNEQICANNREEMFVTVWFGVLDTASGRLRAANAGHEYPALMQPGGRFELLKDKHGLVIGAMEGLRYQEYELQLRPGAKLFVYTDGVPEAMDADNKLFGTERMLEALRREPEASPQRLLQNVRAAVDDFVQDAEQFDDLTMLCVEYRGNAGMQQTYRELKLEAQVEKLPELLGFVERELEAVDCPMKAQLQLAVAAEEVFVNIASYAYAPGTGMAAVRLEISEGPRRVTLQFIDSGVPFDPLQREDPDIRLSAEEREIGGLGIYMTKKTMDEVRYRYENGQNILTLVKHI